MAITINNNSPREQYAASSGQTNFAGTWRIEDEADIKVYLTPVGSAPDDTADILVLTTDYTITGVGVGNSFTVVLNVGATTDDVITILADINFSANYNFLTNQNFDPDDFNEIFSKFDRELKQLRMETRKLQVKYQNSEQVIAKDYKLAQLAANQSWRMDETNTEIEAVVIGDVGPGETWYGVTTGVNTYLVTITDFVGYTTGEIIFLQFGSTNTGASTININGLGGKNLLRYDGTPISSGDLVAGITYTFLYHSNQYYLLGVQRASEASTGISRIATTADVQTGTDDFKYVTSKKLKQDHPGNVFFVDTSGPANVYTGTVSGLSAYTLGLSLNVRISATSTGSSTININGIGVKNIKRTNGANIESGDLVSAQIYHMIYNGSEFRLSSTQISTESGNGIIRLATQAETKAAIAQTLCISPANAVYHPGAAKAWIKFDGTTGVLNDSYRCTLTKNATGLYTVNFGFTMANNSYCVTLASTDPGTPPFPTAPVVYVNVVTTTSCQLRVIGWNVGATGVGNTDVASVFAAFHGDEP